MKWFQANGMWTVQFVNKPLNLSLNFNDRSELMYSTRLKPFARPKCEKMLKLFCSYKLQWCHNKIFNSKCITFMKIFNQYIVFRPRKIYDSQSIFNQFKYNCFVLPTYGFLHSTINPLFMCRRGHNTTAQ